MKSIAMQEDFVSGEDLEKGDEEESIEGFLSDEERDLLVKRLAPCGLPTREIVRVTGASGRTVARIMQRWGIKRKETNEVRKGPAGHLPYVLGHYYALEEVTLDTLEQLARGNGLSLKRLFCLLAEHISPSRWAIRNCLACDLPALTSSPADRYCPVCKRKVKKNRKGIDEFLFYE